MSKIKTTLKEPDVDNRLLDDRGITAERARRGLRDQQTPLMRAVARGTISEQHGRAGAEFLRHWIQCKYPSLASNWKAEISPRGLFGSLSMAPGERETYSRRQIWNAIGAIHDDMDRCGMSNDAISILFLVVCEEQPFEIAGQRIWNVNPISAATLAIRYLKSALRVLSIKWNIS